MAEEYLFAPLKEVTKNKPLQIVQKANISYPLIHKVCFEISPFALLLTIC